MRRGTPPHMRKRRSFFPCWSLMVLKFPNPKHATTHFGDMRCPIRYQFLRPVLLVPTTFDTLSPKAWDGLRHLETISLLVCEFAWDILRQWIVQKASGTPEVFTKRSWALFAIAQNICKKRSKCSIIAGSFWKHVFLSHRHFSNATKRLTRACDIPLADCLGMILKRLSFSLTKTLDKWSLFRN